MWDAGIRKEVAEMEGENPVYPVDASPGLTTTRAYGTLRTGSDSLARSNMTNWSLESGSPPMPSSSQLQATFARSAFLTVTTATN